MWSQVMCHFVKECKFLFFFFSSLMCSTLFHYTLYKFSSDTSFVVLLQFLLLQFGFFLSHPFRTVCSYPKLCCHTLE